MSESVLEVRESVEGGCWVRAVGFPCFTQGEVGEDLRTVVKDAVTCHFETEPERTRLIRLHSVWDEEPAA